MFCLLNIVMKTYQKVPLLNSGLATFTVNEKWI